MRFIAAAAVLGFCATAFADDCASVIALSRVTTTSISDESAVEANAANFCSAYSSSQSQSSSTSFGASYSFLAATFGTSGATTQQVASRYCSAANNYATSSNAYQNYIEAIAPGAYSAYEACKLSSTNNLQYQVNTGSILEKSFAISASFSYIQGATPAVVEFTAGPGVKCKWDSTASTETKIATGHSGTLQCSRTDSSQDTYVTVQMTTASVPPLTLRWPAYKDGVPASALLTLQNALATLNQQVDSIQAITSNLKPARYFERPWSEMQQFNSGCSNTTPAMTGELQCGSAAQGFCKTQGYTGGVPQQANAQVLGFICVK